MAEENIKILEKHDEKLPTNEEVIDSLVEETTNINVNKDNTNQTEANCDKTSVLNSDKDELNEDSELKQTNDVDLEEDDFIDEDHLKDLEIDYTDDDRQRLKEEAEQLKICGNSNFKASEYKEAAFNYTKALRLCPLAFSKDRAVLYANRGAAKVKLNLRESAIEDCTKAVELDSDYLKAYLRRAQLYEQTEKLDEALADYKKILEIDSSHKEAFFATQKLPGQIEERNEKMKNEMFGKLKDLGNMILKPFGLSTNNFQMVKDPNSGGYSINLSQNPTNNS